MATTAAVAPYGSWKSPLTADVVVSKVDRIDNLVVDHDSHTILWSELRPNEGGRHAPLFAKAYDDYSKIEELAPESTSLDTRNRVHEYGGAAIAASKGIAYFTNFADSRIYAKKIGDDSVAAVPVTKEYADNAVRYADMIVDERRGKIYCVLEDHRSKVNNEGTGAKVEAQNSIAMVDIRTGEVTVVASGADFYSSPRLSPDGKQLAFISWNHPNMPWDHTFLHLASLNEDGTAAEIKCLNEGQSEAVMQPLFHPTTGELYCVTDRSGFWNLHKYSASAVASSSSSSQPPAMEPVYLLEGADFSEPAWNFGVCSYVFISDTHIATYFIEKAFYSLGLITLRDDGGATFRRIESPFTLISSLHKLEDQRIVFLGSSPVIPMSIISMDLSSSGAGAGSGSGSLSSPTASSALSLSFPYRTIRGHTEYDPRYTSTPAAIEFPTSDGDVAYGLFYAPKNDDFRAPEGELPPLLVHSHGGPTGHAYVTANPITQYWTSRGVAVLDVNYRGSTGYGREYRNKLLGKWGVYDLDDCVHGALYLAKQGKVDVNRLAIAGGSAGGYTTLCALTFSDTFHVGASYYGVSDLEALAKDTHKFESRYLDRLVGPYPEAKQVYIERSPIHAVDKLSCPLILFQGSDDRVVPPSQAITMYESVKRKGFPVAFLEFEGEQHGFRKAENIKASLEAELYFYSKVFHFTTPHDTISVPIKIENLKKE